MAVGTVGGTLHAHAGARLAQRLLGVTDATTLAMIVGSAGLASNLAALRALATEGIQRGHMALHRKSQPVARAGTAAPGATVAVEGRPDMIRQILRRGRGDARGADGGTTARRCRPSTAPPIRWLDPPPGPWTVERAYAYCEEFARAHTESYPVASRFVPPELRPHLVALYAFARSADDFADEPRVRGPPHRGARSLGGGARAAAPTARPTTRCSSRSPTRSRSAICRSRRSRTC